MRKNLVFLAAILAAYTVTLQAQDESELRIKKALEGRQVLVKMDMPAVENGVEMLFDDAEVTFDQANYNKLVKEYGVALKKGHKARVTAVRITRKGIEIDLDGGGSPSRDWVVGGLRLVEPSPVPKSDREVDLERQVMNESNSASSFARNELDQERHQRMTLDERNRQSYERISGVRNQYIEENRKNWGSKIVIVVRSNKKNTMLGEMSKSLAKYCELLPREAVTK